MLIIRELTIGDLEILTAVANDVFDHEIDAGYTREFLEDPRHHIIAAINDGKMVGFASAVHYIHPDKPSELWINEVGVAGSHQKQGIGKSIMKEMLVLGQKLGCGTAWVLTEKSNRSANGLYRSIGGRIGSDETVMYEFDINKMISGDR